MITLVEELKQDLHDQPVNPLRPVQIRGYQDELAQLQPMMQGVDMDGQPQAFMGAAKGAAIRRAGQVRKILAEQAPKQITGERASRVHARVKEIIDTVIKPAMLPRSAFRRNPPGAVGHLLRTEMHPVFKDAVLTTKRAMRALDPDNADPDYTNMERFRPEGLNPDGTSTFMADAQIRGVFGMTPAARSNWPLGEPTADTSLEQVRRREAAEGDAGRPATARAPKPPKVEKPKRAMSQAQKDALARGRAAAIAKKQGAAPPAPGDIAQTA